MHAFATDGSRLNNRKFSPASRAMMRPLIINRGQGAGEGRGQGRRGEGRGGGTLRGEEKRSSVEEEEEGGRKEI